MQHTRTIYSWADIYNLPTQTKFTDSTGSDYWSLGEGHIIDDCANFVQYDRIELPVTLDIAESSRMRVYKLFGLPTWTARGRGKHRSFKTQAEAFAWALEQVKS
ncbi:hypothetical protein [Nocardia jiangxiensis]|uniref:hypothetical protein n=1 Tax=Nocardia jiangxiensis TaxID=282685 RepID=UPI0002FAAC71|nr:hypothetical protein [Nocardia jiangxiensis]